MKRSLSHNPSLALGALAIGAMLVVAFTTRIQWPADPDQRSAVYAILAFLVGAVIAILAERTQRELKREQHDLKEEQVELKEAQAKIGEFLMEQVNNRNERTATIISLCNSAEQVFRAVTHLPAVGVRDAPDTAPDAYIDALSTALKAGVAVTLVSMSYDEARKYCEDMGFDDQCLSILDWVEERLQLLDRHFANLTLITLPSSAITVNLCHNESSALVYQISRKGDKGTGFKSNDPRILELADGGVSRYVSFGRRNGRAGSS